LGRGQFDTSTGPVKGASATAEVLLPIPAVAGVPHHRKRRRLIFALHGKRE
jgi:hypothetical protein